MATQPLVPQARTVPLGFSAAAIPKVLVIDAERSSLEHCRRMLDNLNYPHHGVATAREALEIVMGDPAIEIVVADAHIPMADAFVLIEEARARAGTLRPLAFILTAEHVTAELALRGLHAEAVDLLTKPLGFEQWSLALRRASRYLAARRGHPEDASLASFGQQVGKLVAMLEAGPARRDPAAATTDQDVMATLRTIINARSLRARFFPSHIFADPAWDILLDLTRAKLENQQVSVSSVCIAASVPMSTALRWVKQMTDAGLLRRWTDPKDRRRDLIALTEATAERMREYLAMVHKSLAAL